jgi:hypothetical protein
MPIGGQELIRHIERIKVLIDSNEQTKRLYEEIVALYGQIDVMPIEGIVSSYQLPLQCAHFEPFHVIWPMRGRPSISIAVGTGRELEAATHELLHLRLGSLGYAKVCMNTVPAFPNPWRAPFLGAVNRIEHEIMKPMFLEMGFLQDRFLAGGEPVELPEELQAFRAGNGPIDPDGWSRAIIEHFRGSPEGANLAWGQRNDGRWLMLPDDWDQQVQ